MLAFWHGRTAGASIEDRKHPRCKLNIKKDAIQCKFLCISC
jgi:hypothetical protein